MENKKPLYKLNGQYWGFILKNRIFNKNSKYFGWVDKENRCWDLIGDYLGEIYNEIHIIKKNIYVKPVGRIPKIPRIAAPRVSEKPNIKTKILKRGYYDVLENL